MSRCGIGSDRWNEGEEYLVLRPSEAAGLTVTLAPGTYSAEWFGVEGREAVEAGETTTDGSTATRVQPSGRSVRPVVLYLKKVGDTP